MRARLVFCIAVFGLLAACQTSYQDMGFTGGVSAKPITSDTYRIVSRGNGFTEREVVQDYTLLKAAETTRDAGGTHFVIISASDATHVGVITTRGPCTRRWSATPHIQRSIQARSSPTTSRGRMCTSACSRFRPGRQHPRGSRCRRHHRDDRSAGPTLSVGQNVLA